MMAKDADYPGMASNMLQDCVDSLFCAAEKSWVEFIATEYDTSKIKEGILASGEIAQLANARCLTITIPFLINSKGRLAIDSKMFKDIMNSFQIDGRLNDFAAHFRYKQTEHDFAHPPCVFQPLFSGTTNSPHGYECFYALRCPGIRQGMDHDPQKWSIRQIAVYQKHDTVNNKAIHMFLGISLSRSNSADIIRHHAQDSPSSPVTMFSLHSALLQHVIACWKTYLADVYDAVEANSEEVLFRKRREDLNQFKDRPDLRNIKESLLNLPLMIMSLTGTIKTLRSEFDEVFPNAASSVEQVQLAKSFDYQLGEMKLLLKRIEMLRERVHDLTTFTQEKLNHLNSRYMMQVAQSTKNDSAAMKYITIITVLFLPATFVATFFSMQLVSVSDGRFHLLNEVWIYFAVTIPLTFITTMGWLFGMKRETARQNLSDSCDSQAVDAFDLEQGLELRNI